jgi:tetratricopeptide (TPR) repeat protein
MNMRDQSSRCLQVSFSPAAHGCGRDADSGAALAAAYRVCRPQGTLALALWLGMLAACGPRAASSAAAHAEKATSCLAADGGDDAAHQALTRAQSAATERPREVNAWVGVGDAWLRVARTYARPGLFTAAQDCAERGLALDANAAPALRLRALVMMNAHRFSEARTQAQALLQHDPSDVLSWATLSDAELELGNVEAASDAVQQMLDRKPCLASYGRAAHVAWLKADRANAKRLYRAAIEAGRQLHDPEPRAWMLVQAAWVFWHEGDYAGARAGFAQALKELPYYAPALEGLGRVQLSAAAQLPAAEASALYKDAIGLLARALSRHPLAETAWWLGDAYTALGDAAHASEAYARVETLA